MIRSIVLFATLFFFGVSSVASASTMVNYWPLDEGIGREARDEVGGKHGTVSGSGEGFGWASGKVGVGLAMSGGAGQGVILPEGFLSGGAGSVSVWFRLNSLNDRNILFSGKSTTDNSVYMALLIDRDGRPMAQMRDVATNPDRRTQGTVILNANEWYHLVVTVDSQRYHVFVNGVEHEVAGNAIPRWFPDLTNQKLGYRIASLDSSALSGSLDGTIDDVRVYDAALSASDIAAPYNETNEMRPTIPVEQRPSASLTAEPLVLKVAGPTTLTWQSANVTACVKGGAWQGGAPISGSETVTVTSNATYTLDCSGKAGTANASVTLEIGGAQGTGSSLNIQGNSTQDIVLANPMTEAERQAKIAELRTKIQQLIKKLAEIIAAMQKTN